MDREGKDSTLDVSEEASGSLAAAGLSDTGVGAVQGLSQVETPEVEEVDLSTPKDFGRFAHEGYQLAAYETFDDVDNEVPVVVTKPDGTEAQGYVDTVIGDTLIDYKTNDMRDWNEAKAVRSAREHGEQMLEYVESSGTPEDAKGWIVATVPPRSEDVRRVYADTLAGYGVGVKFSEAEDQDAVMQAVAAAVDDTERDTGGQ